MTSRGILVVISAPSGGGKTTIIQRILEESDDRIVYSISATTRPPRAHEVDGRDYIFLSPEAFQDKIERGEFIEWARVHGDLYGTPRTPIEQHLSKGKIVLLDIDVQGGLAMKKLYGEEALLIFIMPPSLEGLESRLRERKTESEAALKKRLAVVEQEMQQAKAYDAVVENIVLQDTVEKVKKIIYRRYQEIQGGSNG